MRLWKSCLPPRRKDWTPGDTQVGLFIRTPDGSTVEMTHNTSSEDVAKRAWALMTALMLAHATETEEKKP